MKKLLLVYTTESGFFNTIKEHIKIILNSSGGCRLYHITHGAFGMKAKWKNFMNSVRAEIKMLHKDEFEKEYDTEKKYPAVFEADISLKEKISIREIENLDLNRLIREIKKIS